MSAQKSVYKVVLYSKKEVLLREPKIKDQELAMQVASSQTKQELMVGVIAQRELLKNLIVQIDGKPVDKRQVEDLDSLFNYREYMQLQKVLGDIAGGQDLGNAQIEISVSGDK